jgi:copper chaperone CopZ
MKKITVGIDGMMCGMCEAHIADTIREHFNVKKVKADRKKKQAVILADEDLSEQALHDAIDPTGYTVTSYASEEYQKKGLFGF